MLQPRLNFVIGGVQKGGTSTLDAIFRHHPRIAMARIKETHFFDDESHNWASPDYAKLHAYLETHDTRLRGEATPITLYWRPAIRRIHDYNPEIKILLLLRNPIARAFSHWQHEYARGREFLPFGAAIRSGRARVAVSSQIEGVNRRFSYVERGVYAEHLLYLAKYLPWNNMHCAIAEDFFQDRSPALRRIAAFLQIDEFHRNIPH